MDLYVFFIPPYIFLYMIRVVLMELERVTVICVVLLQGLIDNINNETNTCGSGGGGDCVPEDMDFEASSNTDQIYQGYVDCPEFKTEHEVRLCFVHL
jgi:hypothetical protein